MDWYRRQAEHFGLAISDGTNWHPNAAYNLARLAGHFANLILNHV